MGAMPRVHSNIDIQLLRIWIFGRIQLDGCLVKAIADEEMFDLFLRSRQHPGPERRPQIEHRCRNNLRAVWRRPRPAQHVDVADERGRPRSEPHDYAISFGTRIHLNILIPPGRKQRVDYIGDFGFLKCFARCERLQSGQIGRGEWLLRRLVFNSEDPLSFMLWALAE